MRIAIVSDIHGNLPALEAVLEAADEAGVDGVWCLGDVVGYGAEPDRCTALVRERCGLCLVGNHDLAALGKLDIASFSPAAAAAAEWTQQESAPETMEYLSGLEPSKTEGGVSLYHASPRDPIWEYVLSVPQADECMDVQHSRVAFIGHSHVALFFVRPEGTGKGGDAHGEQAEDGRELDLSKDRWLINPGSVGQPRDGDARAAWLELDTEKWTARYHRRPYDIERAAKAILSAGLPPQLGERLYVGH